MTEANISDMNQLEEMISESNLDSGISVLADKGYMSKKNINLLETLGFQDGLMRKKVKNKDITEEEKLRIKRSVKLDIGLNNLLAY